MVASPRANPNSKILQAGEIMRAKPESVFLKCLCIWTVLYTYETSMDKIVVVDLLRLFASGLFMLKKRTRKGLRAPNPQVTSPVFMILCWCVL